MTDIDRLTRAFENTEYRVQAHDTWHVLTIGKTCPAALSRTLHPHASCAWLITACNPQARQVDEAVNLARNTTLKYLLSMHQQPWWPADSRACDDSWPVEPGVCIAGLDEGLARSLARRFDQAALVAIPRREPVQLIWV